MATTEAETSQDERGSPGGLVYDGFISYAHDGCMFGHSGAALVTCSVARTRLEIR